jgi:hypothetical protein
MQAQPSHSISGPQQKQGRHSAPIIFHRSLTGWTGELKDKHSSGSHSGSQKRSKNNKDILKRWRRTWLATNFAVQATASNLSSATKTVHAGIDTAMKAASGTTEDDFVFINRITISPTTHCTTFIYFWQSARKGKICVRMKKKKSKFS